MLAHGPGLLPAGLTGKRQGGERGHMGPWPQPRGQGPLWDFFLKEAARRHDSSLLKFRTPTEIQVPLLAAASMARISSYADILGVGRAADAVEVGSRPWFRFCPAPLLPVRDVGTWAGSIDAVTSGTPRAADGGNGTPVAPPPSAPVVLAFFFFGFFTGFGARSGIDRRHSGRDAHNIRESATARHFALCSFTAASLTYFSGQLCLLQLKSFDSTFRLRSNAPRGRLLRGPPRDCSVLHAQFQHVI